MKNKTCPFQDWVLTQGTNSAENEHDETDPRTCPDWLRMSITRPTPIRKFLQVPEQDG